MNIIWIGVAAFLGGIVSGALGWLDSDEPFDVRKYTASIIRALIAAVVFAVGYQFANGVTLIAIAAAFCAGAGIDVLGNRISGSIKAGLR